MEEENMKNERKELLDDVADRVEKVIGRTRTVRKLRQSQIISAVLGAVGFALFIDGVLKLFKYFPSWASFSLGLVLMLLTGLLLKNLNR